jgi:hypothetical protein
MVIIMTSTQLWIDYITNLRTRIQGERADLQQRAGSL